MTEVRVKLGAFAAEALAGKLNNGSELASTNFEGAIRFYLREKGTGAAGWAYPEFLRGRTPSEEIELEMSVDDALWTALEKEAASQDISVERLLEHAMFYYAAEVDTGRATERILEDFEAD